MLTGIKTETKVIIQFLKKPLFSLELNSVTTLSRQTFCGMLWFYLGILHRIILRKKNKSINAKQKHQQKLEDVYKFY